MSVIRAIATILALVGVMGFPGTIIVLCGFIYPSQRLIAWFGRIWSRSILFPTGVSIEVADRDRALSLGPALFVGNHQSALDIPILIQVLSGEVRFIAKKSLFQIPMFGWMLTQYGYIAVDRASPRSALVSVNRGFARNKLKPVSVVLFPEGTRSPTGRLLPFRKGAMNICRRAGLPVVPFAIDGAQRVNPRGDFGMYPGSVQLAFADPIPVEEVVAMSTDELHDRVRASIAGLLGQSDSDQSLDRVGVPARNEH